MAKQPDKRTLDSYQSWVSKSFNSENSSDIAKVTNQAIISKTYNDSQIKLLKEKIKAEEKSLKHLNEELKLLQKNHALTKDINDKRNQITATLGKIKNLNRQGVEYLESEIKRIKTITSSYQKQLEYQTASLDKKLEMKRVEADELKSRLDVLEVLRKEGKLTSQRQKERKEIQDKYEDARKRELSLEKSINDEQEKRMTFSQKRAAQEERIAKAQEE